MYERKYDIQNNKLVKRTNGIPLLEDEPCEAIMLVIKDFQKFELEHPVGRIEHDRKKIGGQ